MRQPLHTNATAASIDLTGLTPEHLSCVSVAMIGDSRRGEGRPGPKVNIQFEGFVPDDEDKGFSVAVKMLAEDAMVSALTTLAVIAQQHPEQMDHLRIGWPETAKKMAALLDPPKCDFGTSDSSACVMVKGHPGPCEPEVAQPAPYDGPLSTVDPLDPMEALLASADSAGRAAEVPENLQAMLKGSRLMVDGEGCVWWVHDEGTGRPEAGFHSMARVNPANRPTPKPWTYFVPAEVVE